MSFGWSWFILFMLFFGLPGLLYTFLYLKHGHESTAGYRMLFASLLLKIAIAQLVLAVARFGVVIPLFHFCTNDEGVKTAVMSSWVLIPELVWLVYRVGVMVEETRCSEGSYKDRVTTRYLGTYTNWMIRTQAIICVCVTASMVIAIVLQWGEFGSGKSHQTAINWTTFAGLAVGTLAATLLTRFTEPLMPMDDPTMVAEHPVPIRDESRLPSRDDMDEEIERWRNR